MKGIGKIIILIFGLAFFFVIYVRGQVALLAISYQMDTKAAKLDQMSEEYRRLKFEVDQLKAPRLLEEKMKQLSLKLTLPQEIRVIKMPAPLNSVSQGQMPGVEPFTGRLATFFGRWIDVAQAKTDN